jgi:Na+-transporting NADH:ubiquinone oxidoreductase subunit NqrE
MKSLARCVSVLLWLASVSCAVTVIYAFCVTDVYSNLVGIVVACGMGVTFSAATIASVSLFNSIEEPKP